MISVIVPTYNEEKNISRCLTFLRNQTLPKKEYEIIVSDSSSTDRTVSAARKLSDQVVVCKRVSAGFGRNYGACFARGEYLIFIDADTLVAPTYLEGAKESLEKGIAATGPIKALDENSLLYILYSHWTSIQTRLTILFGAPVINGFSFSVRKKDFDAVGGFSEEDIVCEDIDLCKKLKKRGKFIFNKKMLVHNSNRRVKEIGIFPYALNGLNFFLRGKSHSWTKHRRDF